MNVLADNAELLLAGEALGRLLELTETLAYQRN